jgi:S-formylglutathione hydrolase FrmB
MPHLSRRALLLGGTCVVLAGAAGCYGLVEDGTLPGKYRLASLLGACGGPPPAPRGPLPVRYDAVFWSAYRDRTVRMITLVPAGLSSARGLRLIVALHGLGGDAASMASQVAPAMTAARVTTCAVVTVDGGDAYWHARADGDDPLGMIVYEVLPRAAAAGLVTSRIAITGESMGGYGALLLAERLADGNVPAKTGSAVTGPPRTAPLARPAAVAAISPAIFASYADAEAADRGAFDDPADFASNNVLTSLAALRHVPAWISCGVDDPFEYEASLLRARLARLKGRQPAGGIASGCHDDAFFERSMPAATSFAAAHLGPEKTEEGR